MKRNRLTRRSTAEQMAMAHRDVVEAAEALVEHWRRPLPGQQAYLVAMEDIMENMATMRKLLDELADAVDRLRTHAASNS